MTEKKQHDIFKRNLLKYLGNASQKEVAAAIGVSPQTFNTWCQGIAIPRMDKVQRLADYFGINKSDLIEETSLRREKELHIMSILETLNESQLTSALEYIKFLKTQDSPSSLEQSQPRH